jgi:hypothetical protein
MASWVFSGVVMLDSPKVLGLNLGVVGRYFKSAFCNFFRFLAEALATARATIFS